jgi:predicted aspartyl protease
LNVFRIGCERCGRAGSYRRRGLVKRFGGGIALPDLLVAIIAVAAVLATTATANAIHLRCDAPIVSFGPSDPGKDPVKTVDIERDGPNGQWAILYYTESGNIINRRSQYYIETVAYGATSYWRGVLKINSAIVDQGVIWVDSTTGVYTYQETIRKNGEIIVDMMAHGCVRLDQPDVAAPAQTPAVQSTPVPAPEPITAPRERCEQYYGTAACDHAVAPQPLSGMGESAVPMISDGGTFKVPVTINRQLTLNFVVDSGAADVSIPADVFMTLVRTGTITDADFLDKQTYQLADGSTIPSQRFVIRTLKIGDKTLENVVGGIAPVAGSLLLGQSFLSRFKSWSIDNQRRALILN